MTDIVINNISYPITTTKLVLSNQDLTELPETITRLFDLTELILNNNKLTNLTEFLNRLTNLKFIQLNHN